MLNFITQQRRGTTEEWAKSTVIPQAGEFVIEECKNAPIRIKIGDGIHLFKDLKYIDETTVSALTDLEARYNAHVAYIEGGTPVPDSTLATEVIDARYIDGTSYTSLNEAIQSVSDKRVGGMVYDYEGEVGIRQPYMLYLTDKDNNIIEETGVRIISGSGGGGGGGGASSNVLKIGYITTSPLVVTPNDNAILKFTFSGTDSSGDAILQASATWKVDGKTVSYGTVKDGENEFDVTKYLKIGTTKVLLSVVDDSGAVVTKNWSVQQVDIRIASNFNDKTTYPVDDIIFDYTPYGAVDKKVYFILDGKLIGTVDSGAKLSGNTQRFPIPKQEHGSHLLDIYMEAVINDNTITSNHVLKDILWYDPDKNTNPVIGTINQEFTAKQYDTTNIEYTVYDPNSENPEVIIAVDGKVVSEVVLTNPSNIFAYNTSEIGSHTITITCRETVKTLNCVVEKLDIDVSPVTTGLAFDFNPVGKSNDDTNRLWSDGDVSMSVSDNFDWVNGGYKQDAAGDTYFCVKSGTTATINYNLFSDDAKKTGKEMKLVFKTTNVSNPETTFMSCLDNTTDKDHIGIRMQPNSANIYAQNNNLELAYSEDDIIEFEFNISSLTETVPMIMGYEDGVSTRPLVYDTTFNFKQNTPKPITFGSNDCDVHIYRMKAYTTSLTDVDILNNFIADARTTAEMRSRYTRNQIYDENRKLTAEVLAEKCPWLRVYKLSAPHFTNNKSDKVKDTIIQQIHKGGDPILDNWTAYKAQHSGQGTSSNNYGAAGRNLDFIMNKSGCYIELGDGTTTDAITLTRTSVPVAYLNAKVNIASSNNLTNAMLANRYNRFNPYRRPFVREDGTNVDYIKDTMEFYNCVIFIQETDPDLTTHREFADTDWHFYAIGNIGDSKKTDNTRVTDPDDPYECCVEIMDVGLPLSAFPVDTMINAMGYTVDETTQERTYIWAKDENLGILYEKNADGTYELTKDTSVDLTKTYYVDILEHDDFSEDYTYGWRYLTDEENLDVFNFCKQRWIEFYRFVTTSTDEEFKSNLKDYFVVDSALYYYLFTTRYCMVDNRAKNTFWHYSKTSDGTRKWDLCWDYDNDTSLGLNNYGKQVYRYGLEDIDKDDAGKEVFRQSNSLFFCRIRDLFAAELKAMYKELESQNAWKAESLINEADAWQDEFPEELWRIDIERKYIRTYTSSFIDGEGDSQFLVNMANGKMKYHRRQWERNQEKYMSSKYQIPEGYDTFRIGKPDETNPVVPADYQFTLTPYSYMYLNVWYGDVSRTPYTVRAVPNVPTKVPCPSSLDADIVLVGNSGSLVDFGDLSAMYPTTISVSNAKRIRRLIIGNDTEGYNNKGFTTLTTGANPLLEEINLENISSLNQSLDLRQLINLKRLYAFGTAAKSALFADGGKLEEAELPPLNTITLKNLMYLATNKFTLEHYDDVVDLTVEGCPLIDSLELMQRCSKLRRLRLIDVNIEDTSYEYFRDNIFKLKGLNANEEETPDAWITGTAKFGTLTGSQYNELCTRYPNLNIEYDLLICQLQFKLSPEQDPVYTQLVYSKNNVLVDCVDPVELGVVAEPTKESTVSHHYTYAGWSESYDGIPVIPSPLEKIRKDMILYPTFDAHIRQYTVNFYNNDGTLLNSYDVDYGTEEFKYPANDPKKGLVNNPDAYAFDAWNPEPKNILGPLDCYATYELRPEFIYDIKLEDIQYSLNTSNNTLTVTSYQNTTEKILKLNDVYSVDGVDYTVTTIDGYNDLNSHIDGFRDKNIECIILPETLTTIGKYAFRNNPMLSEITIPENVTEIYAGAFTECNGLLDIYYNAINATAVRFADYKTDPYVFSRIGSSTGAVVHIGNKVEQIPSYVFTQDVKTENKIHIKDVIFDTPSVCHTIKSNAFQLTDITYIDFPESLIYINSFAFEKTKINSLIIPNNVTTLSSDCFAYCLELTDVYIPKSVSSVSSVAFRQSLNAEFTIHPESKFLWTNSCFIDTDSKSVLFGHEDAIIPDNLGLTSIAEFAFAGVSIVTIVIPEGVTRLNASAFRDCKKLKTVTLGSSVQVLYSNCFYGCSALETLDLPLSLKQIADFGIYGCPIKEVTLPEGLESIGSYGLVDNPVLQYLEIPSTVRSLGTEAIRGCTALERLIIKSNNINFLRPAGTDDYNTFLNDEKLGYIEVNWASDGTSTNPSATHLPYLTQKAPWKAGTKNGARVIPVTIKYTDKTLVYNIDGSITELTEEEDA